MSKQTASKSESSSTKIDKVALKEIKSTATAKKPKAKKQKGKGRSKKKRESTSSSIQPQKQKVGHGKKKSLTPKTEKRRAKEPESKVAEIKAQNPSILIDSLTSSEYGRYQHIQRSEEENTTYDSSPLTARQPLSDRNSITRKVVLRRVSPGVPAQARRSKIDETKVVEIVKAGTAAEIEEVHKQLQAENKELSKLQRARRAKRFLELHNEYRKEKFISGFPSSPDIAFFATGGIDSPMSKKVVSKQDIPKSKLENNEYDGDIKTLTNGSTDSGTFLERHRTMRTLKRKEKKESPRKSIGGYCDSSFLTDWVQGSSRKMPDVFSKLPSTPIAMPSQVNSPSVPLSTTLPSQAYGGPAQ